MNINNTTIQKFLPPKLIMLAVIAPAYKPQFFQLALIADLKDDFPKDGKLKSFLKKFYFKVFV